MIASIFAKQKKRGRPATGVTPMVGIRVTATLRKRVEEWAKAQSDNPTLSEAMRRLVEQALASVPAYSVKRADPSVRAAAVSYAERATGKAIDQKLERTGYSNEMKAERKKRLTKIPTALANRSRSEK